ncbi:unnamed protein product [Oikopleura dioica]|uniref:C-type lectin domain-containing protein n=2 Tax=Oikopleura dioica TaxID=34765 RepID=E4XS46_OIKDI|nr:unnamed protein product [Oikopleura dioica]
MNSAKMKESTIIGMKTEQLIWRQSGIIMKTRFFTRKFLKLSDNNSTRISRFGLDCRLMTMKIIQFFCGTIICRLIIQIGLLISLQFKKATIAATSTILWIFQKLGEWKMSNNCETKRNFICKLDKYTINPPDNDAPAHLGSPVECENGWNSLDGGLDCFKTFGKEVIYAEARRSCLSMDSSVASIHDLTINLFVKSLLSTDTSAHLKSAWIGAERTKTSAWKWMDGSNFVFSNFVTDNSDDGNAIIGVDGRWESQDSNSVNGYVCSKMKKFENYLATSEIHHCPG